MDKQISRRLEMQDLYLKYDKLQEENEQLKETLVALSDYHSRCTVCYRFMEGDQCESCSNYYCECSCVPLTTFDITHGEDTTSEGES